MFRPQIMKKTHCAWAHTHISVHSFLPSLGIVLIHRIALLLLLLLFVSLIMPHAVCMCCMYAMGTRELHQIGAMVIKCISRDGSMVTLNRIISFWIFWQFSTRRSIPLWPWQRWRRSDSKLPECPNNWHNNSLVTWSRWDTSWTGIWKVSCVCECVSMTFRQSDSPKEYCSLVTWTLNNTRIKMNIPLNGGAEDKNVNFFLLCPRL